MHSIVEKYEQEAFDKMKRRVEGQPFDKVSGIIFNWVKQGALNKKSFEKIMNSFTEENTIQHEIVKPTISYIVFDGEQKNGVFN